MEKMRLNNISRRYVLRKLEGTLKQKEKLAEGLHLIDFEQLKIENQTLNEKIEERNEELLKLRKKTTTTVQVLTHLKEKLQFVQAENQSLKRDMAKLEIELTNKRDVLTQLKHERDALRADNANRKQSRGLVSSEACPPLRPPLRPPLCPPPALLRPNLPAPHPSRSCPTLPSDPLLRSLLRPPPPTHSRLARRTCSSTTRSGGRTS